MSTTLRTHIRWMIRRDYPDVLDIEHESFEFPWSEEDFVRCMRQRNCIGMVAEHDDLVVGYMLYELHKTRLHILNFAVASRYRRMGVGSQMVAKLTTVLSRSKSRTQIALEVRETNIDAQLFFRSQGFRAVSVLRGFEANGEDAYAMRYRVNVPQDA